MKKIKTTLVTMFPIVIYLATGILIYTYINELNSKGNYDMIKNFMIYFYIIIILVSIIYGVVAVRLLKSIWKPAIINVSSIIIVFAIKNVFDINLQQYASKTFILILQSVFKELFLYSLMVIIPLAVVFGITFVSSIISKCFIKKPIYPSV